MKRSNTSNVAGEFAPLVIKYGPWFLLLLSLIGVDYLLVDWLEVRRPGIHFDVYPMLVTAKEAVFHRQNPYSEEALEVIRRLEPDANLWVSRHYGAGFVYPFYLIYILAPLALLPLPWAIAGWLLANQAMVVGAVTMTLRTLQWSIDWKRLSIGLVALTFLFEPFFETIYLGQFSILALFLLVLTLWLLGKGHYGWAGLTTFLAIVRPQSSALTILFILVWSLARRCWRLWAGLSLAAISLTALSFLFVPTWIMDYPRRLFYWREWSSALSPLESIFGTSFSIPTTAFLAAGMSLVAWRLGRAEVRSHAFILGYCLSVTATYLAFPQSSSYAAAPLMLPLLASLKLLESHSSRWAQPLRWLAWSDLLLLPWGGVIVKGYFAQPLWLWGIPLPLLILLVYLIRTGTLQWANSNTGPRGGS